MQKQFLSLFLGCLFSALTSTSFVAVASAATMRQNAAANEASELAEQHLPSALPHRPKGIVSRIIDGDTLSLEDGRIIRLACIDAPDLVEQYQKERPLGSSRTDIRERNFRSDASSPPPRSPRKKSNHVTQYFAVQSRHALNEIARKQKVLLLAEAENKDRQQRLIADLLLEDGTSLSRFLVENGFAYVVPDINFPEAYQKDLLRLQQGAIRARRGFWLRLLSQSIAQRPWTGNRESGLFYPSTDIFAQKIKPRMRVYFGNLQDAFSQGYAPARSTDFWPQETKLH